MSEYNPHLDFSVSLVFKNGRPEGLDHLLEYLAGERINAREVPHNVTSSDIFIEDISSGALYIRVILAIKAFEKDLEPTVGETWYCDSPIVGAMPTPLYFGPEDKREETLTEYRLDNMLEDFRDLRPTAEQLDRFILQLKAWHLVSKAFDETEA